MLVVPLYHITLKLKKKVVETAARAIIEALFADAKNYSPKYPKIRYPKSKDAHLYEVDLPDIHFGRLSWGEESGENYDIKIARAGVESVINQLLAYARLFPIGRILLPMGNDYFNSDNPQDTTAHGTPMQEDVRWQKTFQMGCGLAMWMIDQCAQIAPVDVLIIPGNHDTQRSFMMGLALNFWYHTNHNVTIDNGPKSRKYYPFGKVLLGFCHGYDEKVKKMPDIMAFEEKDLWAKAKFCEWHTGDKHHREDITFYSKEHVGITVRILSALAIEDTWTFNHGFVGSLRAGESFLWHPENGLVARFIAPPKMEGKC
jgi:hypothetical protein